MERSAAVAPPGTASRPVGGMRREGVVHRDGDGRGDGAAELEGVAGEGDRADSLGGVTVGFAHLGGVVDGAAGVGGAGVGGLEFDLDWG